MRFNPAGLEALHISFRLPDLQSSTTPSIVVGRGEESALSARDSWLHMPSPQRFYEEVTVVLDGFGRCEPYMLHSTTLTIPD